MSAIILDGTKVAAQIKAEVGEEVKELDRRRASSRTGGRAGRAQSGVGNLRPQQGEELRAAWHLQRKTSRRRTTSTTDELLALVDDLNRRDEIDGILVQLPLPPQVDAKKVLLAVSPEKDVDGFHPMNVGYLSTQRPGLVPCTPAGIIEILKRSNIPIAGAEAVVVGRSDIVGKPVAMLLLNGNATVTVCHSKTRDLPAVCRRADILVAAIGKAGMITPDFVKPGATVIDVGMNTMTDPAEFQSFFAGNEKRERDFAAKGSTLMGDVDPKVAEVAGAMTPVPGGVGPLTIAMLMSNTVKAAKLRRGEKVRAVAGTLVSGHPVLAGLSQESLQAMQLETGRLGWKFPGHRETPCRTNHARPRVTSRASVLPGRVPGNSTGDCLALQCGGRPDGWRQRGPGRSPDRDRELRRGGSAVVRALSTPAKRPPSRLVVRFQVQFRGFPRLCGRSDKSLSIWRDGAELPCVWSAVCSCQQRCAHAATGKRLRGRQRRRSDRRPSTRSTTAPTTT